MSSTPEGGWAGRCRAKNGWRCGGAHCVQVREQRAGGSTAGASPAQSWVRAAGVWGVVQAEKKKKKKRGGEVGIGTTPVLSSMPTLCEAGLRAYDIGTTQLQDTRVEAGKQASREAGKLESWLLSSS